MTKRDPLEKFKKFIAERRGEKPGADSGDADPTQVGDVVYDDGYYQYDESLKDVLEQELAQHNLVFPEDPNDEAAYRVLVNQARKINPRLGIEVARARQDMRNVNQSAITREQRKRVDRSSKPKELMEQYLMTTNSNGEAVLNKGLLLGGLAILGLGGFFLAGQAPRAAASSSNVAASSVGKSVENADGSVTTTFSDGSITTKSPDGTETTNYPDRRIVVKDLKTGVTTTKYPDSRVIVTQADGSSSETLADGSVIQRDSSGQVKADAPPEQISGELTTKGILQDGEKPPTEVNTEEITGMSSPPDSAQPVTIPAPLVTPATPIATKSPEADIIPEESSVSSPVASESVSTPTVNSSDKTGVTNPSTSSSYSGNSRSSYSNDSGYVNDPPFIPEPTPVKEIATPEPVVLKPSTKVSPISVSKNKIAAPIAELPQETITIEPVARNTAERSSGAGSIQAAAPTANITIEPVVATKPKQAVQPTAIIKASSVAPAVSTSSSSNAAYGIDTNRLATNINVVAYRRNQNETAQFIRGGSGVSVIEAATRAAESAATNKTEGLLASANRAAADATASSGTTVIYRRKTAEEAPAPIQMPALAKSSGSNSVPNMSSDNTQQNGLLASSAAVEGNYQAASVANASDSNRNTQSIPLQESPYKVGQYLRGKLETGLIIPVIQSDVSSMYVYVRTQDGTLWLGKPSMSDVKRVNINFSEAILRDGKEVKVNAIAYHLDGTQGVKPVFQDVAPTLANDLIRASFGGIKNYVEAKIQATSTSVAQNGTTVVSRQVPSIWESVAGSAMSVFQLPPTQNTFVTVAKLEVEQDIVIVIMPENKLSGK